jgi:type II secretory pathway component PulF
LDRLKLSLNKYLFKSDSSGRKRLWAKLATLIKNGVPIKNALKTLHGRRMQVGKGAAPDTVALSHWIERIDNGSSIAGCTKGWVTDEEQMLLSAGEKSGDILKSLEAICRIMTAKSSIKGAVIGGIAYPTFVVLMLFGFMYLFGYKLIPSFLNLAPVERFTGFGYWVARASMFAQYALLPFIACCLIIVCVFVISLPRWNGKNRVLFDGYKPYSIYRIIQGSSWLISFSALVKSGVRIEDGLEQMAKLSSPWLKIRLFSCLRGLKSGLTVGDALHRAGHNFPDREIIDDLIIYSSLNGFEDSLESLGNEWIESSEKIISSQMKVVFNVLLVVAIMMIAMMVAGMIDMQTQIKDLLQHRQ